MPCERHPRLVGTVRTRVTVDHWGGERYRDFNSRVFLGEKQWKGDPSTPVLFRWQTFAPCQSLGVVRTIFRILFGKPFPKLEEATRRGPAPYFRSAAGAQRDRNKALLPPLRARPHFVRWETMIRERSGEDWPSQPPRRDPAAGFLPLSNSDDVACRTNVLPQHLSCANRHLDSIDPEINGSVSLRDSLGERGLSGSRQSSKDDQQTRTSRLILPAARPNAGMG